MATTLRSERTSGIGIVATQIGNYTAPSTTTGVVVSGLSVANTNLSLPILVNVYLFDGVTPIYLVKNCPIQPGSSVNFADQGNRITLNANDQVFVVSSISASADVIMSVMEIAN